MSYSTERARATEPNRRNRIICVFAAAFQPTSSRIFDVGRSRGGGNGGPAAARRRNEGRRITHARPLVAYGRNNFHKRKTTSTSADLPVIN